MNNEQVKLPMAGNHQQSSCCANSQNPQPFAALEEANWTNGHLELAGRHVYRIVTKLDSKDFSGTLKARWGVGRMNYTVPPGLYAVGEPANSSPVLVSANYKLSFDSLRRELAGLNLWLLILDTGGINVWCAAGKGSFGTAELIRMVKITGLSEVVSHRTLILPQLAAPGVSAHEVRHRCGYNVVYGPVRAADIPGFLETGNTADPSMRRTRFNLIDRLILTPVELTALYKPVLGLTLLLLLLNLFGLLFQGVPVSLPLLLGQTFYDLAPFLVAMLIGAVLVPALLPYIPGRALAWKGWVLGVLWAFAYIFFTATQQHWLPTAAYLLTIPAITAFIGMNFTGSTTYTSLSGVIKEMEIALPLIILSAGLGLISLVMTYFI